MTVNEAIIKLQTFDPEMSIKFYNTHCCSYLATPSFKMVKCPIAYYGEPEINCVIIKDTGVEINGVFI
mgnify:CR=1 FL=1